MKLEDVILRSTRALQPAASAVPVGTFYYVTDELTLERSSGSAWQTMHAGPIPPIKIPVFADFAWINQGGASVDETNGGIYLLAPAGAGNNVRLLKKAAPATPYTITAAFYPMLVNANFAGAGLAWRQSSDGKLIMFSWVYDGSRNYGLTKMTNPTTFSANYTLSAAITPFAQPLWLQISDDGTNRIVRAGTDGRHFIPLHSVGRTDFLTADEVGFWAESNNATYDAGMWLVSWKQS